MRIDQLSLGRVAESFHDVMLLVGPDGAILDASPAALECYGCTLEEMLSAHLGDFEVDGGPAADASATKQSVRDGASRYAEHRRGDGSTFRAEVRSTVTAIDGESATLVMVREAGEPTRPPGADSILRLAEQAAREKAESDRKTEALEHSERWLLESQRVARLGHYVYDIEADRWEGSTPLYDVFGIDESWERDFAGWLAIVHPDDRDRMSRYFTEHVLGEQRPFDLEYRVLRPLDGAELWVHGLGTVTFSKQGRPLSMFGIIQDITERRLADEALKASERRFRQLIEKLPIPLGLVDQSGAVSLRNERFVEVFGYGEDEVATLDDWWLRAYPDERYRQRVREIWDREVASAVADGRDIRPHEYWVTCKDGEERVVEVSGIVLGDDLLATLIDYTERKRAESKLERERSLLGQVEAIGEVGSWRLDLASWEQKWSPEAVRILGLDPAATQGDVPEVLRSIVYPDDRDLFESSPLATMWVDGQGAADFRIVRPDGDVRWVSTRGEIEQDDDGEPIAIVGIVQDVTSRKRAEEERVGTLEEAANVDRLTGLHNRRGFDLVAGQAIAQAQRANLGIGLIYCDVDGLKAINDEFGHAQGDRALLDAASILKFTLRSADAMARIGGDEFIVLAQGSDLDSVVRLDERLQEGFEFFNATNERPYRLSMSSGTAWCAAGEPCVLEELKVRADSEMYAEKLRRRAH